MKKLIFLLLLIIGIGQIFAESNPIFPFEYEKIVLKNGFTAYLIPLDNTEQIAYYSVVRTGSRDEWEKGHSGFAHFFEHMMFRGTKKDPGNAYDKIVTEMGADANAYTTDDYTCYHLVFPSQYLEKVVEIESDRFQNLSYPEPQFRTEAGAVYGEYRKGRVNPYWLIEEELYNLAFTKHTYKHTTIGFEEDIKNMPNMYDYSISFFKRYYRPENVILIMAGNINIPEAKKMIQSYYGNWEKGYVQPKIQPEPPQKEKLYKEISYPGKTKPIMAIAYKSDAFNTDNLSYAGAHLFADLAFGQTSELYKELVLKEQKVEFISPYFGLNRDPNLFVIFTKINEEKDIPYVKQRILETIEQFKQNPVDIERLNSIKNHNKYSFAMRLDTPDHIAGRLARFVALTGEIESVNKWYDLLDKVTPQDIVTGVNTYFSDKNQTIILLKGRK
ncbi:MAG: pitrilysin family protein [Calditrichia bacterium]